MFPYSFIHDRLSFFERSQCLQKLSIYNVLDKCFLFYHMAGFEESV